VSGNARGTVAAEANIRLPRHAASVGRARATLRQQLTAWGVTGEVSETAELLLSELATNAVRHARVSPGREIGVRFELTDGQLRVEVADASDERPEQREAGPDDKGGRGLLLVDTLADDWGVCPRLGVGKLVWFVLKPACKPG
jgi:anti-sigma regulatory factor (Ser/Thr protein kinase)